MKMSNMSLCRIFAFVYVFLTFVMVLAIYYMLQSRDRPDFPANASLIALKMVKREVDFETTTAEEPILDVIADLNVTQVYGLNVTKDYGLNVTTDDYMFNMTETTAGATTVVVKRRGRLSLFDLDPNTVVAIGSGISLFIIAVVAVVLFCNLPKLSNSCDNVEFPVARDTVNVSVVQNVPKEPVITLMTKID